MLLLEPQAILGLQGAWLGPYTALSGSPGSVCSEPEEKSNYVEIPPSSSGFGWKLRVWSSVVAA